MISGVYKVATNLISCPTLPFFNFSIFHFPFSFPLPYPGFSPLPSLSLLLPFPSLSSLSPFPSSLFPSPSPTSFSSQTACFYSPSPGVGGKGNFIHSCMISPTRQSISGRLIPFFLPMFSVNFLFCFLSIEVASRLK